MRILVIDDNADNVSSMVALLRLHGFIVDFAGDGLAALTYLDAPGIPLPDVMILDLRMPGMDGETFMERIAEHRDWAAIPVILNSAATDSEQDHVHHRWPRIIMRPKPCDPYELVATLRQMVVMN